ncbi:MAG: hypothetical protein JRJ65_15600, partial [Deltaproteobacteria bacterium]|nr:hypothetical protein [Deltaproteobacteria bacterium]
GKAFHSRFEQNTGAKVKIVQELIEERIGLSAATHISEDKALIDLFPRVGELFGAKIWLKNPDGISLLKSFPGEMPASIERITEQEVRSLGDVKFYHSLRHHRDLYAVIPIAIRKGETGSLHVLFEKTGSPPPEVQKRFALGLVIIGVIIAILVIPVSRLITNRIKNLMQAVIQIAGGDLSGQRER